MSSKERVARAIEWDLADLRAGRTLTSGDAVDMEQFEDIMDMGYWADIEKRFGGEQSG